jgi:hypothetical protein
MEPTTILGIDNGITGAITAISLQTGQILCKFNMPFLTNTIRNKAGKKRNISEIDGLALREIIMSIDNPEKMVVGLERCPDHANQASTMRSMAHSEATIYNAVLFCGIPRDKVFRIPSNVWQTDILGKMKKGETKLRAEIEARKLWPDENFLASDYSGKGKAPSPDIIDSALIAVWVRDKHLNAAVEMFDDVEEAEEESLNLPKELDTEEFNSKLNEYLAWRKEMKFKPLLQKTLKLRYKLFILWGIPKSIASLEQSMMNGWQGIFEPKEIASSPEIRSSSVRVQRGLRSSDVSI